MNYQKIYDSLIERSRNRNLSCYTEKHHIIPRCLGGTDDICNIAMLTPEEHFVAHQLLVKLYPDNRKLIYAVRVMCFGRKDGRRNNNKLYGWLKRKFSEAHTGFKHSEETKQKISRSRIGKGIAPKTDETKKRMSEAAKGKTRSEEYRKNISNSKKGIPWTQARIDAQNKRKSK